MKNRGGDRNLHMTKLHKKLGKELLKCVEDLDALFSARLTLIQRYFPDYTDHGITHSIRVLEYFAELLEKRDILNQLSEEQAFVCICACLIHDIGMGPISEEELKEANKKGFHVDIDWREKIVRPTHHERSYLWITESKEFDDIAPCFPHHLKKIVGAVAEAHRIIPMNKRDELRDNEEYRFLSAVLRVADQMDLDEARVTHLGVSRSSLPTDDEKQTIEFAKSLCKAKVYLDDQEDKFVLKSRDPLDERTLIIAQGFYNLVDDIIITIESTKHYGWKNRIFLPSELSYDFHVSGQDPESNHVLKADYKNVFKYLSNYLYQDQNEDVVVIREAISNALDSCTLYKREHPDSVCSVSIAHTGDEIWIWDNGCGMAPRVIENHLKVLGSTYYESPWFKGDSTLYDIENIPLLGHYGIGIFSYLLVCDEFEVITKTEVDSPRRVLFSPHYAITIGPLLNSELEQGTVLILRKSRNDKKPFPSKERISEIVSGIFNNSEIPIYLFEDENILAVERGSFEEKTEIQCDSDKTNIHLASQKNVDTDEFNACLRFKIKLNYSHPEISPANREDLFIFNKTMRLSNRTFDRERLISRIENRITFRNLNLTSKISLETPFLSSLLSLNQDILGTSQQMLKLEKGSFCIDASINGRDLYLNLQKSNLVENKAKNTAYDWLIKEAENIAVNCVYRILRNQSLPWVIREYLRNSIIMQIGRGFHHYKLNDSSKALFQELFNGISFVDSATFNTVPFTELIDLSKDNDICIVPIDRVLQDSESYSVKVTALLHPFLMIKYKDRFRVYASVVANKFKNWYAKTLENPRIIYTFYGESMFLNSLDSFKIILQQLGFDHWNVSSDNPYYLGK